MSFEFHGVLAYLGRLAEPKETVGALQPVDQAALNAALRLDLRCEVPGDGLHNPRMVIGPAQRTRIADICKRYHVRRMSLFGSTAMGPERPESDVDLQVEFIPGEAPSGFALVDMQSELVDTFGGRPVDLAFPSVLRNPWRRRAIEAQLQPLYQ